MGLIERFQYILEESKKQYKEMRAEAFKCCVSTDNCEGNRITGNILAFGDNGSFMKNLAEIYEPADKLQMVYIDPPFFSKAAYDAVIKVLGEDGKEYSVKHPAYDDKWPSGIEEYLIMLCTRLYLIKDLLKDEGTVWVHLDWHIVHYAKIFMDEIFGEKNFVNEIIWQYKSGGTTQRHFSRKHDTILVYGKTSKYYFSPLKEKSYNRGLKPYRFKGVKEYQDDIGWYTMVVMRDVWNIDMVGRTSGERTGYATQKPEALLMRIIESSTEEGDLCADFFCGSGTLAAAAEKLNRRWICCDSGRLAIAGCLKRLDEIKAQFSLFDAERDPWIKAYGNGVLKAKIKKKVFVDKILVTITLTGYKIENVGGNGKIGEKGLELINSLKGKNSPQLIDFFGVDFNYDGKVHRPQVIIKRSGGTLPVSCESFVALPFADDLKINVQAVDILGNCTNLSLDGGKLK